MIQLHQTLHGYAGGHRLLASSVSLDIESRKDMGVLSDLSGTVMVRGYEAYLTAYPLPVAEMYVFARTWYAAEMERPGSVWTHSLLLRFADVAQIEHPSALLPLLNRPVGADPDLTRYEAVIELPTRAPVEPPDVDSYNAPLLANIFRALYGQPAPVYLPSSDARRFEGILLDIWAQQWPRLRRTFTFCSGALEPRSLRRCPLDLQVIPRPRPRLDGIMVVLDPSDESPKDWTGVAIRDLRARHRTSFRLFLRRYGVDVTDMRQGFKALAETYQLIGQGAELSELVTTVGAAFRESDNAAKLKQTLFKLTPGSVAEADEAVLHVLAQNAYSDSFSDQQSELQLRLVRISEDAPERLVRVLVGIEHPYRSRIAQQVAHAAITELAAAHVTDLLRTEPLWVSEVLRLRPTIAADDEFWSLPDLIRSDALGILATVWGREADLWRPVAAAVARRDSQAVAQVLQFAGSVMVNALLDTHESTTDGLRLPPWWVALKERTGESVAWLAKHPSPGCGARNLLVHVLDPEADDVSQLGVRPWLGVGAEASSLRQGDQGQRQLAFVLALALRSGEHEAEQLVAEVFPHIHWLAAGNRLVQNNWKLLERHRPLHGDPPPWDRCEWLRCRLVDAATSFGWSSASVIAALPEESARGRAAAYADRFPEGRRLAGAIRATLPPPPQRRHEPKQARARKSRDKKSAKKKPKPTRPWFPF